MNKQRRSKLEKLKNRLEIVKKEIEDVSTELSSILSDEEIAYDSMPESLQSSMRGIDSEEAIDSMYSAIDCLDEAVKNIDDIV